MRIIFVPQFPSELRYQEWWFTEFPKQFRKRGFEVLTLGEDYANMIVHRRSAIDMFSPINQAIELETEQIREYMMLDIRPDDILFVSDISFPGFFCNVLYHKECPKMYAFCHATSMNRFDYFKSLSYSKFPVETSHAFLFDVVFIGSRYHQDKVQEFSDIYWRNTMVTYLPFQPMEAKLSGVAKSIDIMSASRPTPQKVDKELEDYVTEELGVQVQRPMNSNWSQYVWNLNRSKVLLITAHEDTFGYQIADAVTNNCIPIARNSLAYPELLPREYLYDTKEELVMILDQILNRERPIPVPKLLCMEQMNKFYDVICNEMTGEVDHPF